jgi:hypothetical protein
MPRKGKLLAPIVLVLNDTDIIVISEETLE